VASSNPIGFELSAIVGAGGVTQQEVDLASEKNAQEAQCTCFEELMDLERVSNTSMCDRRRLYGITATASFEYVLSSELVPSAVTT
jgi:hypothetical protein